MRTLQGVFHDQKIANRKKIKVIELESEELQQDLKEETHLIALARDEMMDEHQSIDKLNTTLKELQDELKWLEDCIDNVTDITRQTEKKMSIINERLNITLDNADSSRSSKFRKSENQGLEYVPKAENKSEIISRGNCPDTRAATLSHYESIKQSIISDMIEEQEHGEQMTRSIGSVRHSMADTNDKNC